MLAGTFVSGLTCWVVGRIILMTFSLQLIAIHVVTLDNILEYMQIDDFGKKGLCHFWPNLYIYICWFYSNNYFTGNFCLGQST